MFRFYKNKYIYNVVCFLKLWHDLYCYWLLDVELSTKVACLCIIPLWFLHEFKQERDWPECFAKIRSPKPANFRFCRIFRKLQQRGWLAEHLSTKKTICFDYVVQTRLKKKCLDFTGGIQQLFLLSHQLNCHRKKK